MRRGPHPALFAVLILPFGAAFGFVQFALPRIAESHGVSDSAIGKVIAATFLMHTVKVAAAPLVDTTLTRKTWYLIGVAITALSFVALAAMPIAAGELTMLYALVMVAQLPVMFMGFACESFIALTVPDAEKGRAAGWYNAGNYAGVGVGAWAALRLIDAFGPSWIVGAVIGAVTLVCALALRAVPDPVHDHARRLGPAMKALGQDFIRIFVNRYSLTGLVIAMSPVGAAAVQNLFPATAWRWKIDESFHYTVLGVELGASEILGVIGGLIGGLISAGGALIGGWLADRMPRRLAYAISGALLALCSLAMARSPTTPAMFILFMLIYSLFAGLSFAVFSAFVLETIGVGAVATKYNIFAGGANFAIWYSQTLDTVGLDRWGTTGMLFTDAALTAGGITLLLLMYAVVRPRKSVSDS